MRILYAIQGTGNGHIARAIDLVPEIKKYGDVDVLLSGQHCELKLPFEVTYHMQGYGFFFGDKGGIDIKRTWRKNSMIKFLKEVASLPVDQYDVVLSDFEPVSSWACVLKGKKCFGMSHQSAVIDPMAPKPAGRSGLLGQGILKYYAPVTAGLGFHFKRINGHISTPVIRKSIRATSPKNLGHYTVYLPAFSDIHIISVLASMQNVKWQVFSKRVSVPYSFNNIEVRPVESDAFVQSLSTSSGVLCTAGFETPSEALFLGKKLCVVPMKHQYEQSCNAAALKNMGIPVLNQFSVRELPVLKEWVASTERIPVSYPDNVPDVVQQVMALAESFETSAQRLKFPRLAGA